ncbi:protein jagunal homolog 1-like [Antedon mediterranea]|uniref:protein jagunal homolog 1-like n=1 Tax=Antedon mediterranea TaxID=105859 RepID=UPI003AF52986
MASRTGSRPSGSDGSDFDHRERVADHYKISAVLKPKMKICMLLNLVVAVKIAALDGALHMDLLPPPIDTIKIQPWHYIIICSFLSSIVGLSSLSKSNGALLNVYKTGTLLFCLGGTVFGMITHYKELQMYLQTGKGLLIFGLPAIVLQYVGLSIYLVFTLLNYRYASKLSAAWHMKTKRK